MDEFTKEFYNAMLLNAEIVLNEWKKAGTSTEQMKRLVEHKKKKIKRYKEMLKNANSSSSSI
jgi:predicted secreted Zn-dependent protease